MVADGKISFYFMTAAYSTVWHSTRVHTHTHTHL